MDTTRSGESLGPDASKAADPAAAIKDSAPGIGRNLREAASEQVRDTLGKVRDGADEALADIGEKAAARVDGVADTARDLGRSLDEQGQPTLGRFAEDAASSIGEVSERLRSGSIDQLLGDAHRLARSNPGLFVLGSVAVGFGLARFLKASDDHHCAAADRATPDSYASSRAASDRSQFRGGADGY